jgi:predicted DNA-binding ribbon-helix-helix protein
MEPGTYTVFKGPGALDRALKAARASRLGRPKKGSQAVGTAAKSLRLSNDQWAALEDLARKRRTTLHALLRKAVLGVLRKSA